MQEDLNQAYDVGIAKGIWKPVTFSEYGTPVVPVRKQSHPNQPSGAVRECGICFLCMYADDTTLCSFVENFESNDVEREINCELDKVNLWLKANKLSLNVTKTKCMVFHKRKTLPPINLSINNAKVENVIKFNYLGFMLDECLSWNAHIEMIGIKISKAIGIINHLKFIYPQRILFTLYNSLIISHMLYGILLWGKSDNVQTIDK